MRSALWACPPAVVAPVVPAPVDSTISPTMPLPNVPIISALATSVVVGHTSRILSRPSGTSSRSSTTSSSGHSSSRSMRHHRHSSRSRTRSRNRPVDRDHCRNLYKCTTFKYLPAFSQVNSYERLGEMSQFTSRGPLITTASQGLPIVKGPDPLVLSQPFRAPELLMLGKRNQSYQT